MIPDTCKILILGGGSGGITVAARLVRMGFANQITLIEPSASHYYQPLWTLAGVGQVAKESSCRPMAAVMPRGIEWIKDAVKKVNPESNTIETESGRIIRYEVLVVALGLDLNFEKIAGVKETLGRNGVISVYQYDQLEAAVKAVESFAGGTAVFTMPPVPIKCAGAPQKVMYLADSLWRRSGVRPKSQIVFASAGATIFGIKEFAEPLSKVVARKGIETKFNTKLLAVRGNEKVAVFEKTVDGKPVTEEIKFDLLHVVPPMSAPGLIRNSSLASAEEAQKGWLAVDKFTLQHLKFPNVFGVGDVTGIPNSKTGAAIRVQAPVVAGNVGKFLRNETNFLRYDGYSSCPLITDIGKVILAEFGYDGKLMPSFPLDPTKERRLYWYLKKDFLPQMYWHGMLKGRM
jgi:sulfide:quinone oxidoreductase